VCPFSDHTLDDENTLAEDRYGDIDGCERDEQLGYVYDTYVGAAASEGDRRAAPSGGLTSLLIEHLLQTGVVDRAILPQPTGSGPPWHEFRIVRSVAEVASSRGSIYAPLHMQDVLREVIDGPELKYAVVALPCFAKAIRLAQKRVAKLRTRIHTVLGLVCGGCPGSAMQETLAAWSGNASPDRIEFRNKSNAQRANDYAFVAHSDGKDDQRVPFQEMFGFLWINKFAFHRACYFCDDTFAETADATFMDAWLPEYIFDRKGTNLVVVREPQLAVTLAQIEQSGQAVLEKISRQKVIDSQRSVLRFKREVVPAMVQVERQRGRWVPRKRCDAENHSVSHDDARHARRLLVALRAGKVLFKRWKKSRRSKTRFGIRMSALKLALRYALILKRCGLPIKKKKNLVFLGRLATWRSTLARVRHERRSRPVEREPYESKPKHPSERVSSQLPGHADAESAAADEPSHIRSEVHHHGANQ
jgi:coenzyme F420-reducing hydrogenase beta subunit